MDTTTNPSNESCDSSMPLNKCSLWYPHKRTVVILEICALLCFYAGFICSYAVSTSAFFLHVQVTQEDGLLTKGHHWAGFFYYYDVDKGRPVSYVAQDLGVADFDAFFNAARVGAVLAAAMGGINTAVTFFTLLNFSTPYVTLLSAALSLLIAIEEVPSLDAIAHFGFVDFSTESKAMAIFISLSMVLVMHLSRIMTLNVSSAVMMMACLFQSLAFLAYEGNDCKEDGEGVFGGTDCGRSLNNDGTLTLMTCAVWLVGVVLLSFASIKARAKGASYVVIFSAFSEPDGSEPVALDLPDVPV